MRPIAPAKTRIVARFMPTSPIAKVPTGRPSTARSASPWSPVNRQSPEAGGSKTAPWPLASRPCPNRENFPSPSMIRRRRRKETLTFPAKAHNNQKLHLFSEDDIYPVISLISCNSLTQIVRRDISTRSSIPRRDPRRLRCFGGFGRSVDCRTGKFGRS